MRHPAYRWWTVKAWCSLRRGEVGLKLGPVTVVRYHDVVIIADVTEVCVLNRRCWKLRTVYSV